VTLARAYKQTFNIASLLDTDVVDGCDARTRDDVDDRSPTPSFDDAIDLALDALHRHYATGPDAGE
jgi:hypothetical protein